MIVIEYCDSNSETYTQVKNGIIPVVFKGPYNTLKLRYNNVSENYASKVNTTLFNINFVDDIYFFDDSFDPGHTHITHTSIVIKPGDYYEFQITIAKPDDDTCNYRSVDIYIDYTETYFEPSGLICHLELNDNPGGTTTLINSASSYGLTNYPFTLTNCNKTGVGLIELLHDSSIVATNQSVNAIFIKGIMLNPVPSGIGPCSILRIVRNASGDDAYISIDINENYKLTCDVDGTTIDDGIYLNNEANEFVIGLSFATSKDTLFSVDGSFYKSNTVFRRTATEIHIGNGAHFLLTEVALFSTTKSEEFFKQLGITL